MSWFYVVWCSFGEVFSSTDLLYFSQLLPPSPAFGAYLRNCLFDLAESRLIGTAMRWLIRNTHIIKRVSIPICGFMFFHYIPIATAALCPPFVSYLRKCLLFKYTPKACKIQIVTGPRLRTVLDMRPSTTNNPTSNQDPKFTALPSSTLLWAPYSNPN